jgi:uncharacterized membrane protein YfcA
MPVYLVTQHEELRAMWWSIGLATIGVIVGTVLGTRALQWIPDSWFRRVLALVLALLGGAMLLKGLRAG